MDGVSYMIATIDIYAVLGSLQGVYIHMLNNHVVFSNVESLWEGVLWYFHLSFGETWMM